MNVLWFEISEPSGYNNKNSIIGGWQDSLEHILSHQHDVRLSIAFESNFYHAPHKIGNIKFIPLFFKKNIFHKITSKFSWTYNSRQLISKMQGVIKEVKPDIIHIFGTEWPFGLITEHTTIPVVIHIQGSIIECNKHTYPQNYSFFNEACAAFPNIPLFLEILLKPIKDHSRLSMERKVWQENRYYMGRTEWDRTFSLRMHPNRKYFHVNEALREEFLNPSGQWTFQKKDHIILITNGCASFWKGPNILLRTAQILKNKGMKFKWLVIGEMPPHIKKLIEKKEHSSFKENNIKLLGRQTARQIQEKMSKASFYVHCSYVDNSPNVICEAQCIGTPVISTSVGGIPSLIEDNKTGFLVSPNSPPKLANLIISLSKNEFLLKNISQAAKNVARIRHDKNNILAQLLDCYNTVINHHHIND